jgi:seryl-tRNA synthetase
MITLPRLRNNPQEAIARLAIRGIDAKLMIEEVLKLDEEIRSLKSEMESLKAESNAKAASVGKLMKEGNIDEANKIKETAAQSKNTIKSMEEKLAELDASLFDRLVVIPNPPDVSVPTGKNSDDNKIEGVFGTMPQLPEGSLPHWDLAKKYDLIDFDLGVKITGAGFPVYKGKGAILQRALIQFFLNEAGRAGYTEIQPPLMVNAQSGYGTGQLPDKEGQMYYVNEDDLYLIPTAEVPITNIFRDEMIKSEQFPIKYCGYTPCFRREAGSYGAHVRGLNRLHQFDKVEIVQLVHPEKSYETLANMSEYVQSLLSKLGLHYRVLLLCGGDMGFTSAKTYDMEVWSPAQQMWLECSSVSNFETYQSNRLGCRFKDENGKSQLPHTLNGSALALPRIVAALLETYQSSEGIVVPEVLRPYTGFDIIA